MKKHIKLLDQQLINKIAAGEVVERPASAVKELLENSIDAEASEIILNIEDGGLSLIEVADNGKGMNEEDSRLVLEQHATSKITSEEDLYNINSLGFRGEALASIASISTISINTYDNQSNPYLIFTDDKGYPKVEIGKARSQGTTVTVRNIFHKVPARRKFLRSEQTEYKYIYDIFVSLALSHPEISFKLIRDQKTLLSLPTQDLQNRIVDIFPNLSSTSIIPIQYNSNSLSITGYLGHPNTSRSDNSQQYLFLNNRYIRDHLLSKALKEGYTSMIMTGKNPIYFLSINVAPKEVDVNIHPRKIEVKFNEPGKVFSALKNSVFQTLSKHLQQQMYSTASISASDNKLFEKHQIEKTHNYPIKISNKTNTNSIKNSIDFTKNLLNSMYSEVSQVEIPVEHAYLDTVKPIQLFNTYIVFEQKEKLLIIDQHAADERYNFEKLADKILNRQPTSTTSLLIPLSITLSSGEITKINIAHDLLIKLGFKYHIESQNLFLSTIPEMLLNQFHENELRDLIHDISEIDEGSDSITIIERMQEKIIASMACHSSIRAGQKLNEAEMKALVTNLFKCKIPYSCPHGRPIIWELSKNDIEKQFKRKL